MIHIIKDVWLCSSQTIQTLCVDRNIVTRNTTADELEVTVIGAMSHHNWCIRVSLLNSDQVEALSSGRVWNLKLIELDGNSRSIITNKTINFRQ